MLIIINLGHLKYPRWKIWNKVFCDLKKQYLHLYPSLSFLEFTSSLLFGQFIIHYSKVYINDFSFDSDQDIDFLWKFWFISATSRN